jgi:hypothetical protein
MSTHPNAILMLTLTPDDLARKTYRAILAEAGIAEESEGTTSLPIDGEDYHIYVAEEGYDEGLQISAKVGQIMVFDMVTYGYGERIPWSKLEAQKNALEKWATGVCERHHCAYEISVGANYW